MSTQQVPIEEEDKEKRCENLKMMMGSQLKKKKEMVNKYGKVLSPNELKKLKSKEYSKKSWRK